MTYRITAGQHHRLILLISAEMYVIAPCLIFHLLAPPPSFFLLIKAIKITNSLAAGDPRNTQSFLCFRPSARTIAPHAYTFLNAVEKGSRGKHDNASLAARTQAGRYIFEERAGGRQQHTASARLKVNRPL